MPPALERVLNKPPAFPGNVAFFSVALFAGLSNLTLGLAGTLLVHAHPLFWAFVASGVGVISLGTGETLPVGLPWLTVTLRITWLAMGLLFTALLPLAILAS